LIWSGIALSYIPPKERKEKKKGEKNRVAIASFFFAVLLLTLA
jgi:hypothetical protein